MEGEDDVNFSMCMDRRDYQKKLKPLDEPFLRRKPWVEDEAVTKCYTCNEPFTFFFRKHHCRLCYKIFCSECSKYRDQIPKDLLVEEYKQYTWGDYLSSFVTDVELEKQRVCEECHLMVEKINSLKKIIDVFNILNFNIFDLKKAGEYSTNYRHASNFLLSKFRDIQYKIPTIKYSDIEKKMLWLNSNFMSGHSRYLTHLLKNCTSDEDVEKVRVILDRGKNYNCNRDMMCSSNCKPKLLPSDAIVILDHCFSVYKKSGDNLNSLKRLVLKYLKDCPDHEFKCYITFLVYNIRNDGPGSTITNFLLKRCIDNFELINNFYWEINVYPRNTRIFRDHYQRILTALENILSTDEEQRDKLVKIMQGCRFVDVLNCIYKAIVDDGKTKIEMRNNFNIKSKLNIPLNPNLTAKKILIDEIDRKDSATCPMVIPCVVDNSETYTIMFKNEDVRKDQIIMNIIKLMAIVIKREKGIDLDLVTYNILPINKDSGLIEIVEECDTIYHIKESLGLNVINYIMNNNGDSKIDEVRKRFIKSTSVFCVITYLLGVGDRHLDNIMITKDGRLFHIDFGYILGHDPVWSNPNIRITSDIVNAIGGINTEYYADFKKQCTEIYNCLRKNMDVFMVLLMMLPDISNIHLSKHAIRQQVIKRFIPGENYIDAELHLINQLEKSSYTDAVKDIFHYHSREKTAEYYTNKFTTAASGLWNSLTRKS